MIGFDPLEWEQLHDLKKSKGWRYFRNLVVQHRQYLIEKSHSCLKKHEDRKAGEYLAKAEETISIIDLVKHRLTELENSKEK